MLLDVRDVHVHYQKVAALKGVSLKVPSGGIVTIIGANGAGKSTTLRSISGLVRPSSGEIHFEGERIDHLPAEQIVARGIAHVPEGRRVFPDLSVEENLRIGAFLRSDKAQIERDIERIFQRFPRLKERRSQWARTLSGGEQQMVAIGRALLNQPRLLLCDEISLGLAPKVVKEIYQSIPSISGNGTAIVLVEQDVGLAKSASDRLYCMLEGRVTLTGRSADMSREAIGEAYFGASHAVA